MQQSFVPLIKKQKLCNGFMQSFFVNQINLLLIQYNNKTYLLENKCGHFGIALDDAKIEQQQDKVVIVCAQHGISFDLQTGQVVNRPWESCDPIKVWHPVEKEETIGFYSDSTQ
ncbi:MAG: Rieske 2Fe-2S domain-containing protein [gamma proteobacterium symbiont of Taylorina sp.]|nr:Rieske 2Fe-2S domain-containing protein [gamma proteobacterium symbiont of Taylorina sp.]